MDDKNKLAEKHAKLLTAFRNIQSAVSTVRKECLQDRRFYSISGAQWEGKLSEQFANKPQFEVNKIHLSVLKIINEYRNNRVSVDFRSKDGSVNKRMDDLCDGLYRSDEQDSCADEAYDNAFEECVGGGFGAWRLTTSKDDDYDEDDDDDDGSIPRQRIKFEPIFDADSSVFFDLGAKKQDKSDSKYCFVLSSYTPEDYKEKWGDDPATFQKEITNAEFDWCTADAVFVAEYYEIETVNSVTRVFRSVDGSESKFDESDFKNDPELEDRLKAIGSRELRRKTKKINRVHKYILSGSRILEDCGYIAGKFIPIVPAYGKRWYVDNIERCMGHVRLCKDMQRLKNMQLSQLAENSAYSTREKPIFSPEQMAGHVTQWEQDNIKNYPYLLKNLIRDASGNVINTPIEYTRSPNIPPAMAALIQLTDSDMKEILGNQEQGEKMVSGISGIAVELIQQRLDMQTFIYMSNFKKAMKRSGEIWLSMAKEIYVEDDRIMKLTKRDGKSSSIKLGQTALNENGVQYRDNSLSEANSNVVSGVGPSSTSERAAIVRSLMGMLQFAQDPETQSILISMILMNLEGEGLDEIQRHFRTKLIRMGVIAPTTEEMAALQAEIQNQPPDPNAVFLQSAAEEAQAKASKARAEVVETIADSELKRAKTAETLAKTDETKLKTVTAAIDTAMSEIEKGGISQAAPAGGRIWQ